MNIARFIQANRLVYPEATKTERIELTVARNFVFTHIAGPTLAQSISVFLYMTDPHPGFACWTMDRLPSGDFCCCRSGLKLFGKLAPVATDFRGIAVLRRAVRRLFYGGVSFRLLALAARQRVARLLLLGRSTVDGIGDVRRKHRRFRRRLFPVRFSGGVAHVAVGDGRLDFDPFRDRLHVVDGDFLRQHQCPCAPNSSAKANGTPPPRFASSERRSWRTRRIAASRFFCPR